MQDFNLNTTMSVNLSEIKTFIESDKFIQFLLNNTTDFAVAAFVLQALEDKIDELTKEDA